MDAGNAPINFESEGAAVSLSVEGAGSPSNTMWPGPKPTCMPSFIVIRPTVCDVTDRTDRQTDRQTNKQTDNGPIA